MSVSFHLLSLGRYFTLAVVLGSVSCVEEEGVGGRGRMGGGAGQEGACASRGH